MMRQPDTRTATVLPFPAKPRAIERLARTDRLSLLEWEAAQSCDAVDGAWYHGEAVREADRIHHA